MKGLKLLALTHFNEVEKMKIKYGEDDDDWGDDDEDEDDDWGSDDDDE